MSLIKDLISNAGGTVAGFSKDAPVGTTVQGHITRADVMQTSDYDTGKPEFWDDGTPKQQLRVVVQTGTRDPMVQDDTGERAIYVKWWGEQRKALIEAVKAAGADDVEVGGMFLAYFSGTKPNEKNPRLNDSKLYQYRYQAPAQTAGLDLNGQVPGQVPGQAPQAQQQAAPAPQVQQYQQPVQQQMAAPQAALQQQQMAAQAYQQPQAAPVPDAFSQLGAQALPVQQQQAAPMQQAAAQQQVPAPAPAVAVDVEKIRQLAGLGLDDQQINAATGADFTTIAAVRAAG